MTLHNPPWPVERLPGDKAGARTAARQWVRTLAAPAVGAAAHRLRQSGFLPTRGIWGVYQPRHDETALGWLLDPEWTARVAYAHALPNGELVFVTWNGRDALVTDASGTASPALDLRVPDEQVSTVMVPGLAFDARGRRLGRGRGFYDRTLARIPGALRVAVTDERRLFWQVPAVTHDEPVDVVVTEARVHFTAARPLPGA
jgi:5,10-methenyltetrahydrofolate synthetase